MRDPASTEPTRVRRPERSRRLRFEMSSGTASTDLLLPPTHVALKNWKCLRWGARTRVSAKVARSADHRLGRVASALPIPGSASSWPEVDWAQTESDLKGL